MLLEQGTTNILIKGISEVVYQVAETDLELFGGKGVLDGHFEQVYEPLQGVLVHWVDAREVDYAEEEQARTVGHAAVALARFVDLLLGYLGVLDTLVDL